MIRREIAALFLDASIPRMSRSRLAGFSRPALHAHRLAFDHPRSGRRLVFEAPGPDDLRNLWRHLGGTWPDFDAADPGRHRHRDTP